MAQLYIVRVAGREYGPIDRDALRQWAAEGRLLPENEVRVIENHNWFTAAALDRVFGEGEAATAAAPPQPGPPPLPAHGAGGESATAPGQILEATWNDYLRGIGTFFLVMLPVGISGAIASVAADWIQPGPTGELDRADYAGLGLLLISFLCYCLTWPVCEGAVVLGSADLAEGRRIRAQPLLSRALRHKRGLYSAAALAWATYFFWLVVPAAGMGVATGLFRESAPWAWGVTVLALGVGMVWMLSKIFIRNLFRAQASVFQGLGGMEAIRHSHELASERGTPWYRRPLWTAALVYLVWTVLLIVVTLLTSVPITAMMLGNRWAEIQQAGGVPSAELLDMAGVPFWPWKAAGYVVQTLVQIVLQAYPIVGCTLLYLARRRPRLDPAETPPPPTSGD